MMPCPDDALPLAVTAAPIRVSFITRSRLAATEISTGKSVITGNGKNPGLWFQGERWLGMLEFSQAWDGDGKP